MDKPLLNVDIPIQHLDLCVDGGKEFVNHGRPAAGAATGHWLEINAVWLQPGPTEPRALEGGQAVCIPTGTFRSRLKFETHSSIKIIQYP